MDIYLEVHEHHRQLGLLLEKRKMLLNEYLHLCMFDQDSSQVRKSCICHVMSARMLFFDFVSGKTFECSVFFWNKIEGSHLYLQLCAYRNIYNC